MIVLKNEMTLKELADKFGVDKKIQIVCDDDNGVVLYFSRKQKDLSKISYSFDMGM